MHKNSVENMYNTVSFISIFTNSSRKWDYSFEGFVKNYTFLVHNEIQVMHWKNQQCSLYPVTVAIYWRQSSPSKSNSLCFISCDLMQGVDFVHMVIKATVAFVKNFILSGLPKVHYFFDSCLGQYKNCKNFLKFCYHDYDFDVSRT